MDLGEVNDRTIKQFRAGGPIEGMHRERILLLTTTGRRSGERRTTPLMFYGQDNRLLVIASNVGAPSHPDWYLNLAADSKVTVEVGDESYEAVATTLEGDEREREWTTVKQAYRFFADHETKTDRTIPVVALTRA
jgi:deazaflavin-dependent oxidoreductase (nitroreductase family)